MDQKNLKDQKEDSVISFSRYDSSDKRTLEGTIVDNKRYGFNLLNTREKIIRFNGEYHISSPSLGQTLRWSKRWVEFGWEFGSIDETLLLVKDVGQCCFYTSQNTAEKNISLFLDSLGVKAKIAYNIERSFSVCRLEIIVIKKGGFQLVSISRLGLHLIHNELDALSEKPIYSFPENGNKKFEEIHCLQNGTIVCVVADQEIHSVSLCILTKDHKMNCIWSGTPNCSVSSVEGSHNSHYVAFEVVSFNSQSNLHVLNIKDDYSFDPIPLEGRLLDLKWFAKDKESQLIAIDESGQLFTITLNPKPELSLTPNISPQHIARA